MAFGVGEDLSITVSADTADFTAGINSAQRSLGNFRPDAIQTAAALQVLQGRADEAGDEIMQTGAQATAASGGLTSFTGSTTAATGATTSLSTVLVVSLIPALGLLATTLVPVTAALAGFVAIAGSIAGIGIIGAIAAIATDTERLKGEFMTLAAEVQEAFAPAIALATEVLSIWMDEFSDIIPALVPSQAVIQQLAGDFANLGEVVIDSLPALLELATTLATEFLPPFIELLEDVLPEIPGMIMDLVSVFETMIPKFQEAGGNLFDLLGPMNELGITVLEVIGPALSRLTELTTDAIEGFNNLDSTLQGMGVAGTFLTSIAAALAVLTTGPIGAAIAGIIALGTAFTTNFRGIRSAVLDVVNTFRTRFEPLISVLLTEGRRLANFFGGQLMLNLRALGRLASTVAGVIGEAWKNNGNTITTGIRSLISSFADLTIAIFERFYPAFRFVVNGVTTIWQKFGDEFAAVFGVMFKFIGTAIRNLSLFVDIVTNLIEGDFRGALNSMNQILDNTLSFFQDVLSGLLEYLTDLGLVNVAMAVVTGLQTVFVTGFNNMYNTIVGILEGIVNRVIDTLDVLPNEITSKLGFSLEDGIDLPKRTTDPGEIQEQAQAQAGEIRVILDERTDVVEGRIEEGAERVINAESRGLRRNTGSPTGVR